ncbi:IclR family transcriptional regulator [Novosphingobium sp. PhB57]|jgi:DNA-binding IclR family transcriptional regulator|uniref:IclR family transcriptional regulator n=1 Tax=unclassified Novosphingobium TaxID=2644732 RepID=UPI001043D2EB|nr:IclR family transcriptional regulator [Novosphingobium sp. PhB57]TCU57413.1 IclR family transcriptional regulator [Novosphingobium sp. PhB57]
MTALRDDKPEVEVKGTQTLMRALDIMDEVIGGPIRAADLARKLGMSKTTAHRLVQALKSRGYLSVTSDGFGLGPKLLELGVMATEQIDYVRVARPFMEKLSEKTGFCVFVGKREGDWSRHLDRVTGRQRLRVATAPGDRRPIAETGLGKALLLDEDEKVWEDLYREANGGKVSAKAVKEYVALMREHKAHGYVLHDSELGDGVRSIAVPIRDARREICIAISIASAAHYLTDDIVDDLVAAIVATAGQVGEAVGYRAPRG